MRNPGKIQMGSHWYLRFEQRRWNAAGTAGQNGLGRSVHKISDCTRVSFSEKKPWLLPASCAMSGTRKRYECTNEIGLAIIIVHR